MPPAYPAEVPQYPYGQPPVEKAEQISI
jgi:hypothetical protein